MTPSIGGRILWWHRHWVLKVVIAPRCDAESYLNLLPGASTPVKPGNRTRVRLPRLPGANGRKKRNDVSIPVDIWGLYVFRVGFLETIDAAF